MAVKATATITLSTYRDVDSIVRYYKLQASTSTAPTKPTTIPPSGWTDTEPSYTSGSTNTLYYTDLSMFSDGSFEYSVVNKSSSYEAAKEAYNKAVAAGEVADQAKNDIDNLAIGGRNLFRHSSCGEHETTLNTYQSVGSFTQFNNCLTFDPADTVGETYTLSFYAKSPNGTTQLQVYNRNGNPRYFYFSTSLDNALSTEWKYYTYTFTNVDRGETYINVHNRIEIYAPQQTGVIVKKIKLEKGNRATDWSPAPEDQVEKNKVIAEINASDETVLIKGERVNLVGLVSFEALNDDVKDTIYDVQTVLDNWAYDTNKTYINGGNIYTGSITAVQLASGSVTADKITVDDLRSIKALIGGFKIGNTSIYSGSKSSYGNANSGLFLGSGGTLDFGSSTNYVRFDGSNLDIKARSLTFEDTDVATAISNAAKVATNYMHFDAATGLIVGDHTATSLAGNTQILSTGVNIRNGTTILSKFEAGSIQLGADGARRILINTSGFNLYNASGTSISNFTDSDIRLGLTSSYHTRINSSGLTISNGTTTLATYGGSSIQLGANTQAHVTMNSSGRLEFWNASSASMGVFTGTEARFGLLSSYNTYLGADRFDMRYGTTVLTSIKDTSITLGKTGTGNRNVYIDSDSIDIRNGTTVLSSFESNNIYLGKNNAGAKMIFGANAFIINQGTNVWDDGARTELVSADELVVTSGSRAYHTTYYENADLDSRAESVIDIASRQAISGDEGAHGNISIYTLDGPANSTSWDSRADIGMVSDCITLSITDSEANISQLTLSQTDLRMNDNPVMTAYKIGSYYGMTACGNETCWFRTTTLGIIPYESNSSVGSSSLGTSTWPFKNIYGKNIYGNIELTANQYYEDNAVYGLNFNNSDVIGANSIYFGDAANSQGEGLQFYRDATHWDTLRAYNGVLYFSPNRPHGGTSTTYTVWHSGNFEDTGWQSLTLDSSYFAAYNSSSSPKIRRLGKVVNLTGVIKTTSTINSGAEANIFTAVLASQFRPSGRIITVCQGSGQSLWICIVETNGWVSLSRYRNGESATSVSTGAWLPFNITYMVD